MKKLNKGFTIIELLVVVAMTGILATTMKPQIFKEIKKATVATVQNKLGIIRTQLSINELLLDELPDLVNGSESLLESYNIETTPGFTGDDGISYPETNQVVDERDNTGGWLYDRTEGQMYANLPDGAYTGDEEYEIWDEDSSTEI